MSCCGRVPRHVTGEIESRRVYKPGQCCHPSLRFIEAPHTPLEWTIDIFVIATGVFLAVTLPFLFLALAGGPRYDGMSGCTGSIWSPILGSSLNDCRGHTHTNISTTIKELKRGDYMFGAGLAQCKGVDPSGRGANRLLPFCARTSTKILYEDVDTADDISYSAFKIIGNEDGMYRICARMQLALDFPGTSTFDGIVLERFNGYTMCSYVALLNTTKVIEKTVEYNCGDKTRAQLAKYLWTSGTPKTHYFVGGCSVPSLGGILNLTSTTEEHEWCNDLFGILRNTTHYEHAWAQDTILHDLFAAELPTCVDSIPKTLYNSFGAACSV